jgi:hypothetical protein
MRRLLLVALVWSSHVTATELARPPKPHVQPVAAAWPADIPRTVVAVSVTAVEHTVLLRESCGWPGGAMRAYHAHQGRITWACWGYNETGVTFQWSTGTHTTMPFRAFRTERGSTLTYPVLYAQLNSPK